MANIAIFGGTFNPFHIGHYEMLGYICELSFIDKVFVMPDKIPPHKNFDSVVDDVHRQNMCNVVCDEFVKAELCLVEFERDGKSYTFDTLNLLKERFPNDNFWVVIGGDMLSTLDTWYNWQSLLKIASFIAFKRDGISDFDKSYERLSNLGAHIEIIDAQITNVSSTMLRQKINKNLLPTSVYDYIVKKGIYNV